MVKSCDLGLENAARGQGQNLHPEVIVFTIRTDPKGPVIWSRLPATTLTLMQPYR